MIEFGASGVEHFAAIAYDHHPIANGEDFLDAMGNEDHARSAARQLAHALK
jgi:hypothetical protein